MTRILRAAGAAALLLATGFAGRAGAGQLVSPADREWARQALAQEASLAAPAGKNTVAVLYFRNETKDPSLDPWQKGIPLLLVTDLSTVPGIVVVERTRLQALVEEIGLGKSGLVEEKTAPRVGRLLGARWLVGGGIGRARPPAVDVEAKAADIPSGAAAGTVPAQGTVDRLFDIEKDLLFGLLRLLDVKVSPEEERRLRKPCSTNPTALASLFLAVDAGDRGDLDAASGYYRRALAADPSVCLAREGLEEIEAARAAPPAAGRRTRELLGTIREGTSLTDSLTTKEPLLRGGKPLDVPGARTSPTGVGVTFP